jgi:hypothetical protein
MTLIISSWRVRKTRENNNNTRFIVEGEEVPSETCVKIKVRHRVRWIQRPKDHVPWRRLKSGGRLKTWRSLKVWRWNAKVRWHHSLRWRHPFSESLYLEKVILKEGTDIPIGGRLKGVGCPLIIGAKIGSKEVKRCLWQGIDRKNLTRS